MSELIREFTITTLLAQAGTTDIDFLTYEPTLSRVRIDPSVAAVIDGSPAPAGATRVIERSTDLITWTTVRGGTEAPVAADDLVVDDYEFTENAENHYRIVVYFTGSVFWTFRDQITVTLDPCQPWLKSISFPFVNRIIEGSTASARTRPARMGVFDIVGRSRGIAVTDVRSGREYELTIATMTALDRIGVEALFAPGDVVLLQVPIDYPIPGGYYAVGNLVEDPRDMPWDRRWWTLPLTEVAPPGPDIVGASITWRGLANRYSDWDAVIAANAVWRDLLELVGDPADVVVP